MALALALGVGAIVPAVAPATEIPSPAYYASYAPYYEGRFVDAGKSFRETPAMVGVNGKWVDSIPRFAMMGECHYQLGQYNDALDAYAAAMNLYLGFPDFLLRVEWSSPRPARTPIRIPWGPSGPIEKNVVIGDYPFAEKLVTGNVINAGKIVIDQRTVKAVNVQEVCRTLAVAIRRYGEIKGPTARYDPLLIDVIDKLSGPTTKAGHWSQSLVDVLKGVANRAAGRAEALELLKRGRLAAGEYEHPLTALALLELGHVALMDGDYKVAGDLFEKASLAAVHFSDKNSSCMYGTPDLVEEAFRYGFIAHRLANHKKRFAVAKDAAEWAFKKRCPALQASLLMDLAESEASLRNTSAADAVLGSVRQLLLKSPDMADSRISARFNHLQSLVRYQQGRVGEGDAALASAMKFQRRSSLWLNHIVMADNLVQKPVTGFRPRDAIQLYEYVLREPLKRDWEIDPLESLSLQMGPRGQDNLAMERWFKLARETTGPNLLPALEVADLVRRYRFRSTQEFGGKLLSLRWLLEAPVEQLDQPFLQHRQDLLASYPEYDKLSKQVQAVKTDLRRLPLAIDPKADKALADDQKGKLAEIARLSAAQEVLLRQLAADRVAVPALFPPRRPTADILAGLEKGQSLLVFFATTASAESPSRLYAFLLTGGKKAIPSWEVQQSMTLSGRSTTLPGAMQALLREMGHFSRDRDIPLAQLKKTDWQTPAAEIFKGLFVPAATTAGTGPPAIPAETDELVIVPDSVLWYLSFEALQVPAAGGKMQSLISKYRVRYAPTMSLAVPDKLGRKAGGNLAVSVGQLMPGKGEDERAKAAFDDLRRVIPTAVQLPAVLPGYSSVYGTLFDRLAVLDDIEPASPLGWRPVRTRTGVGKEFASTLDGWLPLPWGGPDQIMLPGFHTPAENALSDKEKHAGGMDVFLSTCGLMATGSRTIVLSRWRTGGKTSFDLMREFAQELPQADAARAWQRSVLLCTETPLAPDQEPRVAGGAGAATINASHPFFWSGYMVVDTGIRPAAAAPTDPPPKAAVRAANLQQRASP